LTAKKTVFIETKGNTQIGDIIVVFSDIPRSTLKADLAYLVQEYYLEKTGIGRAMVYYPRK
jgi:hypothetical protein